MTTFDNKYKLINNVSNYTITLTLKRKTLYTTLIVLFCSCIISMQNNIATERIFCERKMPDDSSETYVIPCVKRP